MPRVVWGLATILVLALLAERWLVLDRVAFRQTDQDQVVMWYGASEFAKGRFHEPRFFGQDYGTMLEALLAAPFVSFGARHAIVLPLVTSFLALAPFGVLGFRAWRRANPIGFLTSMALPLSLPIRYHFMTSFPRGLVTGGFVAALALPFALGARRPIHWFLAGTLLLLSVSVLPNALLLALPLAVVSCLENTRSAVSRLWWLAGAATAALVHLGAQDFYRIDPPAAFFSVPLPPGGSLGWTSLLASWVEPERFLSDVLPFGLSGWGGLAWALLLPPMALFALRSPVRALASAGTSLLVLLAMGHPRIGLGTESVFYSWSRHFLPLPVVVVLGVLWIEEAAGRASGPVLGALAVVVTALGLGGFWQGVATLDTSAKKEMASEQGYVFHRRVDRVEARCSELALHLEATGARLIVFPHSPDLILVYGCAALEPAVRTLCPSYDRRAWVLREELPKVEERFLLYDFPWPIIKRAERLAQISVRMESPACILVQGNTRRLSSFFRKVGISRRTDMAGL